MKTLLVLAAMAGLGVAGCHRHHLPHHHVAPKPHHPSPPVPAPHKVVVIPKGHACHAHCGHYHHGGKVYHMDNHVHGHNCGHTLQGGIWIRIN